MKVSEIFYSLQGEGRRAGKASIFIRLAGCSAKHACYAAGIRCDTEFESGKEYTKEELLTAIDGYPCRWIVWTGGEPADQLTNEVVEFFRSKNFLQAIETSGLKAVPNVDWISVSPKVAEHVLAKNFPDGVTELRYVRHSGQAIPEPVINADFYFVSPHSDGNLINNDNLKHCIDLCLENPSWSLSVQQHKQWFVL